jgi:cell division protease FtsH
VSEPAGAPKPDVPAAAGPSWRRWIVPILVLAVFWGVTLFNAEQGKEPEIAYSSFYSLVEADKVDRVTFVGHALSGTLKAAEEVDGRHVREFRTVLPALEDKELVPLLRTHKVAVTAKSEEQPLALRILVGLLPWVLFGGIWLWLSRRAQRALGGGTGAAALFGGRLEGHSRRFSEETDVRVRFDDVAGLKTAKRDLSEIVEFLKEPERFRRLGARVPRGVLLVGPPGAGKTLLARAVAGEAGVPFFSINGSEFIELFVGVGASRVRELFETAKKVAPAILFIDEIDAVGRARGTGLGGGHDEREQTLNQLLSEMDGFSRNDLTIVLAATNRPDVLDGALLRPGRFDRRVVIDRPERPARRAILEVHTRKNPLAPEVSLDAVAAATPGASGADLANLVNEAALIATRRGAPSLAMEDFWQALDKILIGDLRETPLSPNERTRIAVHESGHALVASLCPDAEPVKRVSIIPRGMALGATMQLPGEDKHIATRSELRTKLRVFAGGFAAEALVFGETSSGAQNDLQQATEVGYDMVAHYGMSETVGPVYYEHRAEHPFLGQRLAADAGISEGTVRALDLEVQRLMAEAVAEATALLRANRPLLDHLVEALLEHETVERGELEALLDAAKNAAPPSGAARAAAGAA